MSSDEKPPRPAATVVVVRDAALGIEVLLLRRAERGDLNSGAWVFPGGLVDAADRAALPHCRGLDAAVADARLGVGAHALDYWAAAVRECFEEAGLLFARERDGRPLVLDAQRAARLDAWRGPLQRGEQSLAALCHEERLTLAIDELVYFSHWVTPIGRPKRFDTRFFIARAPAGQESAHDDGELVEQLWLSPTAALTRTEPLKLMTPTQKTLEAIARFDDVDALLAWARQPREVPLIQPQIGTGRQGTRPVTPDEPAFAELRRIDPECRGDVSYDINPGVAVRLSARVLRVTAHNGSVMTGPGTNSYLVGGGPRNEWAVVDPGPAEASHVGAILAAAPGPIRWIFATHTHLDHSPGCALLKAHTGAAVHGRKADHPEWQDASFAPDRELCGGERFAIDEGVTLTAVHTPGHASNHLCYRLEEERTLFTGDHVMQLSTVVINPPDGDMAAYLASLRALCAEELDWLAPGHGFLMAQPRAAFERIIAHRLQREAKVLAGLRELGQPDESALLAHVYADVPERMHPMALRSLRAHLYKLRSEQRVHEQAGSWRLL
ncbi:MBL fold metallo-hydrolase [uncultured Piscinibacter sp.]|uniref:MBL fold metallo-hydrolase n=1 Tax=uncultured Piscinibacter sp. TaxID=1131835 RepID=UPI002604BBB9|nr:MBL fold metallo-hydrolase [uncultured Piscinibacter sp.]